MSDDREIDPEALRAEVEQIKDAMGLEERYPSQFRYWLLFGVLVFLASLGSQVIVVEGLSPNLHGVVWFSLMGFGGVLQWWGTREDPAGSGSQETKPRLGFIWLAMFSLAAVFLFTLDPAMETLETPPPQSVLFALFVGLTGVAYLVVGESLRAYYIRRRDRLTFYIGGAWMLVLAVLIPNVAVLHTWAYAAFGVAYVIHAGVSYLALK